MLMLKIDKKKQKKLKIIKTKTKVGKMIDAKRFCYIADIL